MSVLIKGMQMPKNCIKCPLQFGGWCYVSPPEIDERVAPTVDEAVEQGKPEWCPLVDLGKHGDLIDRDELRAKFPEPKDMIDPQQALVHITGVWAEIDCADVVIEAEGE